MGKNFRETLNEQMKDPEFRAEWEAQEPERQIMHAILEGRQNCNLTQEQLAQVTGINQANISRLEKGTRQSLAADAQASGRRDGHGAEAGIRPPCPAAALK